MGGDGSGAFCEGTVSASSRSQGRGQRAREAGWHGVVVDEAQTVWARALGNKRRAGGDGARRRRGLVDQAARGSGGRERGEVRRGGGGGEENKPARRACRSFLSCRIFSSSSRERASSSSARRSPSSRTCDRNLDTSSDMALGWGGIMSRSRRSQAAWELGFRKQLARRHRLLTGS